MNVSSSSLSFNNNNNNKDKKKKTNSWWKFINKKFKWHFNSNEKIKREKSKNFIDEDLFSSTSSSASSLLSTKLIDDNCFFCINETTNGLRVNLTYPHLTSIADSKKTLIKIYRLKIGKTTVGSLDSNDIVIKANDIEENHCSITYDDDKNETILNPFARLCSVDSVLIDRPYILKFGGYLPSLSLFTVLTFLNYFIGDTICFGVSHYFRFNNPFEDKMKVIKNKSSLKKFNADDEQAREDILPFKGELEFFIFLRNCMLQEDWPPTEYC